MEWKKGLKLIPLFFLMLFLTAALLGAAVLGLGVTGKGKSLLRIDVAVAGGNEDEMTEKALQLVQQMDVIKSICIFHRVSAAEADQKVQDGTFDAALYLTEDMYEDINEGYNTPVNIRISDEPTLAGNLFTELVETGVHDLQIAESAVYAVYDVSAEYPTRRSTRKIANRMADRFISLFLARGTFFKTTVLSPYGDMTVLQFAVISLLLIFPLLLGIGFAPFYRTDETVTGRALVRIGVPRLYQSGVKILVMTGIIWLFMMLLAGICTVPELLREYHFLKPAAMILPALGMAAYIHLVYNLLPGEGGSYLYLITSALMVVFAGGLFPLSMMPQAMIRISRCLPFYEWQLFLSKAVNSHADLRTGGAVLIAAVVMFLIAEGTAKIKEGVSR